MQALLAKVGLLFTVTLAGCSSAKDPGGLLASMPAASIQVTSSSLLDVYHAAGSQQFLAQQLGSLNSTSWTNLAARMGKVKSASFAIDGAVLNADVADSGDALEIKAALAKLDAESGSVGETFKGLGIDATTVISLADLQDAAAQINLLNSGHGHNTPKAQRSLALLFFASQALPQNTGLGLTDSVHDQVEATFGLIKCALTLGARCNGHGWMDKLNQAGDNPQQQPQQCEKSTTAGKPGLCTSKDGL